MKYQFLAEHQQEYPVKTMCRVLGVAVSDYYGWLRRLGEYGVGGADCAVVSVKPPGV